MPRDSDLSLSSSIYPIIAEIKDRRGESFSEDEMPGYVSPSLKNMCADLSQLTEFNRAADVLVSSIKEKSKICVFGDYDADGVCSITSMVSFLREMGNEPVKVFVPDRMSDGHGLSESVAQKIIEDIPDVLIVLDCGTTSGSVIQKLSPLIKKILVIDHHGAKGETRPEFPENAVLVNLAIDANPSFRSQWGIGSAGVLTYGVILHATRVWRLLNDRPDYPDDQTIMEILIDCLALAALTAITDMVPLKGINRAIVKVGLKYVSRLNGIRALAIAFDKPLDPDRITPEDVGFRYGPVLNAAGRIAHGKTALEVMGALNCEHLPTTARHAVMINTERKAIQQDVIDSCMDKISEIVSDLDDLTNGMIIQNSDFHPGVVGLAASRLLEMTNRPAIVIGMNGSGSGRSIEGFNIGDFVRLHVEKGNLAKGGGHSGAAGFTIADNDQALSAFKTDFMETTKGMLRPARLADLIRHGNLDKIDLAALYNTMAPFGMGNPSIMVRVNEPDITFQKWFGSENQHWKCKIGTKNGGVEFLIFNVENAKSKTIQEIAVGKKNFNKGEIKAIIGTLRNSFDTYWNRYIVSVMIEDIVF